MAKAKSVAIPASIRRQLASLNHRVSWLEAALKPRKERAPVDRARAARERDNAEWQTRHEAMIEHHKQQRIQRLREDPDLLKIARELDKKENDFLRARGLKPNPSSIPKELRQRIRR